MSLLPNTLTFDQTRLSIIDRHREPWLTARELARALGYKDERAVLRIYPRNQDEFTLEMTCTVKLTATSIGRRTDGGLQETRYNSVSLNTALVLEHLLEHYDDGQWHAMSQRALGGEIGINQVSVRKVLIRLDEWGLISRKAGSRAAPGEIRVHSRKIRQQLKQSTLSADDQLPWLH